MESAQIVKSVVGRPDSKIAGGVMAPNFKNEDIRNMRCQKWQRASQFTLLSRLVSLTGDSHMTEENNSGLS